MSHSNTLKTIGRYAESLVTKYTGVAFRGAKLDEIFNYVKIDNRIGSSGQPTADQFTTIKQAGYEVVINLLPADVENALADERNVVTDLGMEYVHIPVIFKAPTDQNFDDFVAAMDDHKDRRVWVHCAANARVSVFLAKFRRDKLGMSEDLAHAPIGKVWEPFGVWKQFLEK